MIKFDKSSHWYRCRDGEPKAQHDADLRIARKEFLYPSVTNIDKAVFKNEFLDQWKLEQIVLAAVQHPKQPHEDEEGYSNRLYQLSLDKPRDAADFGAKIHDAIEGYPSCPSEELKPWFDRYAEWHEQNVFTVEASEKIMVDHDIGVAGKCDRIVTLNDGRRALIDYKTQGIKKDEKGKKKKPVYYESWPRQLGFYAVCDAKEQKTFPEIPLCISMVMDSDDPNGFYWKLWDNSEIRFSYLQFCVGAWIWFSGNSKRKAYWPQPKGPFHPSLSIPMPL